MSEEQLDILDESGRRLGTKTRRQAHSDGDWHALAFVWCAWRAAAGVRLFLQVRAHPDDPFAGNIDAPAGGHVLAGETPLEGACREFREEVGIEVGADELVDLGGLRREGDIGPCRRVFQHFFLLPRPVALAEARFNDEVSGFLEADLDELAAVLDRRRPQTEGTARLAASPAETVRLAITPASLDSYGEAILDVFRRSFVGIGRYLRTGAADLSVWD